MHDMQAWRGLLVEEPADPFRMTVHSMKDPGESEAQNCPDKEGGEDRFLLPLDLNGRPRDKVDSNPNERNHTCTISHLYNITPVQCHTCTVITVNS